VEGAEHESAELEPRRRVVGVGIDGERVRGVALVVEADEAGVDARAREKV